jgi:hypothetical protein
VLPVNKNAVTLILDNRLREDYRGKLLWIDGIAYTHEVPQDKPLTLTVRKPYTLTCRVTHKGKKVRITADIEGRRIMEWEGTSNSLVPLYRDVGEHKPEAGIGAGGGTVVLQSLEVRLFNGRFIDFR